MLVDDVFVRELQSHVTPPVQALLDVGIRIETEHFRDIQRRSDEFGWTFYCVRQRGGPYFAHMDFSVPYGFSEDSAPDEIFRVLIEFRDGHLRDSIRDPQFMMLFRDHEAQMQAQARIQQQRAPERFNNVPSYVDGGLVPNTPRALMDPVPSDQRPGQRLAALGFGDSRKPAPPKQPVIQLQPKALAGMRGLRKKISQL